MRRKEKEITIHTEIADILMSNTICRIALSDDDAPYIVPMNYGYRDNTLYLHSAREGRKIDIIRKNNRVCFEISDSIEPVKSEIACKFSTRYRSVIGFGEIFHIDGKKEKNAALQIIMEQHTGSRDWDFDPAMLEKIAVLEIRISSLTGKKSGL